jgi:hypothetical protein
MTRTEQAYVKRLKKRIDNLLTGYRIIKTWLSFPNTDDTIYHIGSLATMKIQDEETAQAKEEKRSE